MEKNKFNANSSIVWDTAPAVEWAEAYPLGNGCIGAMVFGGVVNDITSLNHDLLWRRFIKQPTFHTHKDIEEVKDLCRKGNYNEAENKLLSTLPNQNALYINPFVAAFDQYIHLCVEEDSITNYKRYLDLSTGIAYSEFDSNGITYKKEYFCSADEKIFVTHISASQPCNLTGFISISRYCDPECEVTGGVNKDTIFTTGKFEEGVEFAAALKIYNRNGRLTSGKNNYGSETDVIPQKEFGHGFTFSRDEQFNPDRGPSIYFDTCDEIFIVTSLCVDNENSHPLEHCIESVNSEFCFDTIHKSHCKKFNSYYNRINLSIAGDFDFNIPTSEIIRISRKENTISPALCELAFNMSRYIAISSGMTKNYPNEIKAPINLQGLWNRDIRPAWESDYHLDLNIEMCYWPLPSMALTDLMEPFLAWAERLLPQAKHTAHDLYGCSGAAYNGCCDFNTIGSTDVVIFGALGISGWIVQILWIYYEHNPSEELLKRIYKIMQEIDIFYTEMLEENGENVLTFPFGSSPEMSIIENNHIQWLASASTFDLTMTKEFYTNYKSAAIILDDSQAIKKSDTILSHLQNPHIMNNGMLCEWTKEHVENEPGHRHRSPLAAFCPGSLYTQYTDHEMVTAMDKLLMHRLEAGNKMSASFSYSWDAQILARLSKGDDAYSMLESLLLVHSHDNMLLSTNDWDGKAGGLAWFTGVKVMQVEAQLSLASAISEMLYQDNKNIIRILPALPSNIPSGKINGITGRYGVKCDIEWNKGKLSLLRLTVKENRELKILLPCNITSPTITKNGIKTEYARNGELVVINAEKNSEYLITEKCIC